MNTSLAELLDCYHELLHLPDITPVLAVLGTVAANRLPGDPVWTLLVGPPSSGKTEIVDSLRLLPEAAAVSTLTKASLLSGHAGGSGGLLLTRFREGSGLLLVKDFTSVLSEAAATRSEILALLREVFDGHVERYVGNRDAPLAWAGKVSLVGAVTEEIEAHRTAIAVMGERFVYVPMPQNTAEDRAAVVARAMANRGTGRMMRQQLATDVATFFERLDDKDLTVVLDVEEREWIAAGADFASRARSPVLRDSHTREVLLVPEPEVGARLAVELYQLACGLKWIGTPRPLREDVIRGAVQASVQRIRRLVLRRLLEANGSFSTAEMALTLQLPSNTVRRALEELAALGMVHSSQEAYRQQWSVAKAARERWKTVSLTIQEPGDCCVEPRR